MAGYLRRRQGQLDLAFQLFEQAHNDAADVPAFQAFDSTSLPLLLLFLSYIEAHTHVSLSNFIIFRFLIRYVSVRLQMYCEFERGYGHYLNLEWHLAMERLQNFCDSATTANCVIDSIVPLSFFLLVADVLTEWRVGRECGVWISSVCVFHACILLRDALSAREGAGADEEGRRGDAQGTRDTVSLLFSSLLRVCVG
jgi:hypothetical protein